MCNETRMEPNRTQGLQEIYDAPDIAQGDRACVVYQQLVVIVRYAEFEGNVHRKKRHRCVLQQRLGAVVRAATREGISTRPD